MKDLFNRLDTIEKVLKSNIKVNALVVGECIEPNGVIFAGLVFYWEI